MHSIRRGTLYGAFFWSHWLRRNCVAFFLACIVSIVINALLGQIVYAIPDALRLQLPQPVWLFVDLITGAGTGVLGGLLLGAIQHYLFWQPRVPRSQWMRVTALGGALVWPLTV